LTSILGHLNPIRPINISLPPTLLFSI
jgi:hypothetical protein